MLVFGEKGEPETKQSYQSREPTNSVHIRDGVGHKIEPGPCQLKASALATAPTLSHNVDVLYDVYKSALALI